MITNTNTLQSNFFAFREKEKKRKKKEINESVKGNQLAKFRKASDDDFKNFF